MSGPINPDVAPPSGAPIGSRDAAPPPAIDVRQVGFAYRPGQSVLDGVSGRLEAGRLTAILGPNGSGKSTLLKLMLGRLTPGTGQVRLAGRPVSAWSGRERARRVAYVPQRGGAAFGFSVREVVAMGRFAFGDRAFVDEAMAAVGLTALADRPVVELSGGQRQRVMVARAWAQSQGQAQQAVPKEVPGVGVWLADEPVSSLDLAHVHGTMSLLRDRAEAGLAVAVVLHSIDVAERWADRVWLLDRGRRVVEGAPAEVLRPEVLGPVYGVRLRGGAVAGRRVLLVDGLAEGKRGTLTTETER